MKSFALGVKIYNFGKLKMQGRDRVGVVKGHFRIVDII